MNRAWPRGRELRITCPACQGDMIIVEKTNARMPSPLEAIASDYQRTHPNHYLDSTVPFVRAFVLKVVERWQSTRNAS